MAELGETGRQRTLQIIRGQAQAHNDRPVGIAPDEVALDTVPVAHRAGGTPSMPIHPAIAARGSKELHQHSALSRGDVRQGRRAQIEGEGAFAEWTDPPSTSRWQSAGVSFRRSIPAEQALTEVAA